MKTETTYKKPSHWSIAHNGWCQSWQIIIHGDAGIETCRWVSGNDHMVAESAIATVQAHFAGDWSFRAGELIDYCGCHGGGLSRSGRPAADYQITGPGCRIRFETDEDLPRGGIARKRGDHAEFRVWVKEHPEIYSNVGQAYRAINRGTI